MESKMNVVNLIEFNELDDKNRVSLMSFFRKIGLPHVYWERVIPTFKQGESLIVVGQSDRPWPPWGSGSQKIRVLLHAYKKDRETMYLSSIFVSNKDITNIGLMSAVLKEMLQSLVKRGRTKVCYVVSEDSILANRVLVDVGFVKTDEPYLTEEARYRIYVIEVKALLKNLGLDTITSAELLNDEIENHPKYRHIALFHGMLQLATRKDPHEVLAKPDGGPGPGS